MLFRSVFGAGGSILTVPILVFLFHYPPVLAAHYSLFIVGMVSAYGAWSGLRGSEIRIREVLAFAAPAMLGMFLIKKLIIPSLPEKIFWDGHFLFSLNQATLAIFGCFMLTASLSMIFLSVRDQSNLKERGLLDQLVLVFVGSLVGLLTGFVGAGGGFLIVPALVFLARMPVKDATRASLFVIALNSIWGFTVGSKGWDQIPFSILLFMMSVAMFGMFLGIRLQSRLPAARLKPAFGVFVLVMGIYILYRSSHY